MIGMTKEVEAVSSMLDASFDIAADSGMPLLSLVATTFAMALCVCLRHQLFRCPVNVA